MKISGDVLPKGNAKKCGRNTISTVKITNFFKASSTHIDRVNMKNSEVIIENEKGKHLRTSGDALVIKGECQGYGAVAEDIQYDSNLKH